MGLFMGGQRGRRGSKGDSEEGASGRLVRMTNAAGGWGGEESGRWRTARTECALHLGSVWGGRAEVAGEKSFEQFLLRRVS